MSSDVVKNPPSECPPYYKDAYVWAMRGLFCLATPVICLSAYCIITHSTTSMRTLKWMLLHQIFWFLVSETTMTVLVCPVLLVTNSATSMNGLLNVLGVPPFIQNNIPSTVIGGVAASSIALFENRFHTSLPPYSVYKLRDRIRSVMFVTRLVVLTCMGVPVLFFTSPDETASKLEYAKEFPCLAEELLKPETVFVPKVTLGLYDPLVKFLVFFIVAETLFYIIGAIVMLRKTCEELQISENTRQLQRMFLKALAFQEVFPWLLAFMPKNIFVIVSNTTSSKNLNVNNLTTWLMTTHGMWASITLLIVMRPYREFLLKALRLNILKTTKVASGSVHLSAGATPSFVA